MQKQKQHDWDDDEAPKGGQIQDDPALKDAASKGRDLLKRMTAAQKTKRRQGHWEMCCGVRRWIED